MATLLSVVPSLDSNVFHLLLATGLGCAGAVLWTTRNSGDTNGVLRTARALRLAGAGLLAAAFVRSLLYVWNDVHGSAGSEAMLFVGASGIALVHAVRSSPPMVWSRL